MLTESSAGVILTIMGTSQVDVFDLSITGALGTAGVGVSMPLGNTATVALNQVTVSGGGGIGVAADGGTLTASRSTVAHNSGGGVSLSGAAFALTNNMIVNNGGNSSALGGVDIESITTTATHQLAFNTITANQGPNNVDTGVLCGSVVTVPIALDSDIIYGNLVGGSAVQFGGNANCTATYSDIGPDGTGSGTNINADPGFVNATQGNYHLAAGSPCIDAADPAATLTIDIDGDTRPQGSGFDIGADEYKP
ncbi:MAG TPA: choice-of-anchor Q domain-containing protein [Polyangiales bacterium]|nr:choice-of-anchor Q domain-containing protein [Polyangiales bacterium]